MASPKLTKKQKTFVKGYLETGNGTQAALAAYDTDKPLVAAVIAAENLVKPNIVEAIKDGSKDEQIESAYNSLLVSERLDYFVFAKSMSDSEIEAHINSLGIKVINIRPSEKGKLAFFTMPDGNVRAKGVEIAMKVKGGYAPERRINVNVEVEASSEIKDLTQKLNDVYRGTTKDPDAPSTAS